MARLNVGGYYKDKDGMTLRFAGMKNDTEGVFLNKSGDAVFVNVDEVEKFGDGGEVGDQNKEMLMNLAIQFKHHSAELLNVLEKHDHIDAWVVAKAERAATDLSDITHFLEGQSHDMGEGDGEFDDEYAEGGEVGEEQKLVNVERNTKYLGYDITINGLVAYNADNPTKKFLLWGGDIYKDGNSIVTIPANYDSFSLVLARAMKIVRELNNGTYKSGINLFSPKAMMKMRMYKDGGKVPMDTVTEILELSQSSNRNDVMKAKEMFESMSDAEKRDFKRQLDEGDAADEGIYDGFLYLISDENKFAYGGYMARGGEVRYKIKGNNFSAQIENGREFKRHIERAFQNQTSEHNYPQNFIQEIAYTGKIVKHNGSNYLKDYSYKGTLTKFEFLDNADFIKALSYVDRPAIRKFEDGGMMGMGGGMNTMTIGVDKSNVMHPTYFVYNSESGTKKYGFKTREEAERYIRSNMSGKMGMGGATFSDKVRSISGSLEGKSVNAKYRSEYGRRYSKQEAKEAAQRIAGSMRKKGY